MQTKASDDHSGRSLRGDLGAQSPAYAGVGSRETPHEILALMTDVAKILGQHGWTLRSGGARGADTAFEDGAKGFKREIYLPWRGFNGHLSDDSIISESHAPSSPPVPDRRF